MRPNFHRRVLGVLAEARLAPLYDISSILPHLGEGEIQAETRDLKLAMKIDKTYPLDKVMPRHWERCTSSAKVSAEHTMKAIRHQLAVMPDLVSDCAVRIRAQGLTHEIIGRLVDTIAARAEGLSKIYGME